MYQLLPQVGFLACVKPCGKKREWAVVLNRTVDMQRPERFFSFLPMSTWVGELANSLRLALLELEQIVLHFLRIFGSVLENLYQVDVQTSSSRDVEGVINLNRRAHRFACK